MTSRFFIIMALVVVTTGCYNSENDYQRLLVEKESLAQELSVARQEKIILTQALDNIKKEREGLQILLNISQSLVPGGSPGSTAIALPPLRVLGTPVVGVEEDDYWVQSPIAPAVTVIPPTAPRPPAARPTASTTASNGIYVTQPGDVLSSIAFKHATTTTRLLELNPQIRSRPDYMIWANDKIKVP